jgi:hypothetical protein
VLASTVLLLLLLLLLVALLLAARPSSGDGEFGANYEDTKYGIRILSTKYGWIYIKQTQNDNLTSDPIL